MVAKRGLSVTTYVIFPRPTEPISISDAFLVYVIAENTERGLVSAKRMSQALTLNPSLYQAKGTGPSTDGLDDVILKKALGPNSNVKNIGKSKSGNLSKISIHRKYRFAEILIR